MKKIVLFVAAAVAVAFAACNACQEQAEEAVVEETKVDSSVRLGGLWDGETKHQAGSVWDTNGMSPTLDTAQGGGRQPHIVEINEDSFIRAKELLLKKLAGDVKENAVSLKEEFRRYILYERLTCKKALE